MTFETLLKALTDNPTVLNYYKSLESKMNNNNGIPVSLNKIGGSDFYTVETVFSNDCQIDIHLVDRYDGTREIAITQYSNISDKFWTDDEKWFVIAQTK